LNAEVGKHFRLGFFDSQQVVAGRAILCDAGAVLDQVVAVVAAWRLPTLGLGTKVPLL
jgi:hypothetical protein